MRTYKRPKTKKVKVKKRKQARLFRWRRIMAVRAPVRAPEAKVVAEETLRVYHGSPTKGITRLRANSWVSVYPHVARIMGLPWQDTDLRKPYRFTKSIAFKKGRKPKGPVYVYVGSIPTDSIVKNTQRDNYPHEFKIKQALSVTPLIEEILNEALPARGGASLGTQFRSFRSKRSQRQNREKKFSSRSILNKATSGHVLTQRARDYLSLRNPSKTAVQSLPQGQRAMARKLYHPVKKVVKLYP